MFYGTKIAKGSFKDTQEMVKEANLLMGDAIMNFRTVQSFGHEELVVEKFRELMEPAAAKNIRADIGIGVAFGLSQFVNFLINAALFLIASYVFELMPETSTQDVFTAIFAMLFAAQQAGQSAGWGPDIGKA